MEFVEYWEVVLWICFFGGDIGRGPSVPAAFGHSGLGHCRRRVSRGRRGHVGAEKDIFAFTADQIYRIHCGPAMPSKLTYTQAVPPRYAGNEADDNYI